MECRDDLSGLYEASGLKKIFENIDIEKERLEKIEKTKKQKETEFWNDVNPVWKDIESEKDIFDETNEIDPFWLT